LRTPTRWRSDDCVEVPNVGSDEAMWALACLQPGGSDEVPGTGDEVWVATELGDRSRPIWLGRLVGN